MDTSMTEVEQVIQVVQKDDLSRARKEVLEKIEQIQFPPERISWLITLNELYFHLGTIYAFKLLFEGRVGWASIITVIIGGYAAGFGITIGAHRLWAHRSFKAKAGLRYVLAVCQSLAVQGPLLHWVTWHRVHHKYSDTKLDPHNASRGFFYSHVGWLLTYNPKLFAIQRAHANMEDVEADPVIIWQDKYYGYMVLFLGVIIPPLIPWYFFNEEFASAWYAAVCTRITFSQNFTFTVNSLAHLYGYQPYDKNIYPRENRLVSLLAIGEGWHNYHHTFPWDYRTSEFGGSYRFNPSANIIDFCAYMGWAYDLKTASPQVVQARVKRTGK